MGLNLVERYCSTRSYEDATAIGEENMRILKSMEQTVILVVITCMFVLFTNNEAYSLDNVTLGTVTLGTGTPGGGFLAPD